VIQNSTVADVSGLTDMLVTTFDDDPVVNWYIRQDRKRALAFREFFELALSRQSLPFGEVYHMEDYKAAALWVPPGHWQLGIRDQLLLAPAILRIAGVRLLKRALIGLAAMEAAHPPEPHMYLLFLGTHPAHRGRGMGGTMLMDMLTRCDAEKVPVYLENTKPENESFYRHFGFEVTGDIRLAEDGPYYRGMWRAPR
jgi:ribosomal protein S18 acetylase RimI-like enzyme